MALQMAVYITVTVGVVINMALYLHVVHFYCRDVVIHDEGSERCIQRE